MKNFDLRQFLNDNPLLKEESNEGIPVSELKPGEKFTFRGKEFTFKKLRPDISDNAAEVELPNGRPSVVSFGGNVNTGEEAEIGPHHFGQGKGHHIDEFLGFGKKKEEPEEEEEEEETGPEEKLKSGLTINFVMKPEEVMDKDRLGNLMYKIAEKYSTDWQNDVLKLAINPSKEQIYLSHPKVSDQKVSDNKWIEDLVEFLEKADSGIVRIVNDIGIPEDVYFHPKHYSVKPPEPSEEEVEVDANTAERMANSIAKALQENEILKNFFLDALAETGIDPSDLSSIYNAFDNPDVLVQLGKKIDQAIKKSKEVDKEKSTTNELKVSDSLRQLVELGAIFGTTFGSISGNVPLAAAGGILLLTALILAPKEDEDDSVKERYDRSKRIDAGGLDTTTLHSVSMVIDNATGYLYGINDDNTIDWKNSFSAHDELDQDFIDSLSPEDRAVVAKFSSQLEEEILSEGNCPNCGASGQSGQWTGMYCKRCKYAA